MSIEKITETQLDFVDGVPAVGQSRIDWIQNGEYLDAATSATDNGGALNRGSVKVQKNTDKINVELNKTKKSVNDLIDLVEVHDAIINTSGDGTNIYDRVRVAELKIQEHDDDIVGLTSKSNANAQSILDVNTRITTTVDPQIVNTKKMLGNYKGFDVDGNPDVNAPGLGVKGQVERNMEKITDHDNRINGLESWWDGDTPDVLIRSTRDLRNELGATADKKEKNVYHRLDDAESHVTTAELELTEINTKIGDVSFPIQYTKADGTIITVNNISEYSFAVNADLNIVESQIGGLTTVVNKSVTDIEEINQLDVITDQRIDVLESIVGLSPTDGIRSTITAIDNREANNALRFNNLIGNLSDIVNLELTPRVTDLEEDMQIVKPAIIGSGSVADPDVVRLGIRSTNASMYNDMYLPYINGSGFILDSSEHNVDSNYSRRYIDGVWQWVALDAFDVVVGNNKVIRNTSGIQAISYLNRVDSNAVVVFGSNNNDIALRGNIIESVNFGVGANIKYNGTDFIKFGDITEIGNNKQFQFNIDNKSSLVVKYGNEIKDIIHSGNLSDYVNDIDPRNGYSLNRNASISADTQSGVDTKIVTVDYDTNEFRLSSVDVDTVINGKVKSLVMKYGHGVSGYTDGNTVVHMIGFKSVGSIDYIVHGDTAATTALRTTGDDLRSVKILTGTDVAHTIWHDGIDAPSDGAFYARKDGSWTAFNVGGNGGGLADDAPDNGMPYSRVSINGIGSWEALGSKNIILNNNIGIKYNTTADGAVDGLSTKVDGTLTIGTVGSTRKLVLGNKLDTFVLGVGSKLRGTNADLTVVDIVSIDNENDIMLGDLATACYFAKQPFIDVNGESYKVWHDGIDSPRDNKYYARKDGQWTSVFNGVDPDSDVNTSKAFKSMGVNIGYSELIGIDYIVNLGQTGQYTRIHGKVMDFTLARPIDGGSTDIKGVIGGQEIHVIGIKDNVAGVKQVTLGDSTADLKISAIAATINGNKITTTADDAPSDGKRYSRRGGEWVESYYYGNFATNVPANPVEGDVFFEFIN